MECNCGAREWARRGGLSAAARLTPQERKARAARAGKEAARLRTLRAALKRAQADSKKGLDNGEKETIIDACAVREDGK